MFIDWQAAAPLEYQSTGVVWCSIELKWNNNGIKKEPAEELRKHGFSSFKWQNEIEGKKKTWFQGLFLSFQFKETMGFNIPFQ